MYDSSVFEKIDSKKMANDIAFSLIKLSQKESFPHFLII